MDDDSLTVRTYTQKSSEHRETPEETKSNQDKPEEFYNRPDCCVQDYLAMSYNDPQTELVVHSHLLKIFKPGSLQSFTECDYFDII